MNLALYLQTGVFMGDSWKISLPRMPSARNRMDEIHTDVGGTGH
jgi:hypothetical protein